MRLPLCFVFIHWFTAPCGVQKKRVYNTFFFVAKMLISLKWKKEFTRVAILQSILPRQKKNKNKEALKWKQAK